MSGSRRCAGWWMIIPTSSPATARGPRGTPGASAYAAVLGEDVLNGEVKKETLASLAEMLVNRTDRAGVSFGVSRPFAVDRNICHFYGMVGRFGRRS